MRLLKMDDLTICGRIAVAEQNVFQFLQVGDYHIPCTQKFRCVSIINMFTYQVANFNIVKDNTEEIRKCYLVPHSHHEVIIFATLMLANPPSLRLTGERISGLENKFVSCMAFIDTNIFVNHETSIRVYNRWGLHATSPSLIKHEP